MDNSKQYWFIDANNYAHYIDAPSREAANEIYKSRIGNLDGVVAYPIANCPYCNRPQRVPYADFNYRKGKETCRGYACEAKHVHNMAIRRQRPDSDILFIPNPLG